MLTWLGILFCVTQSACFSGLNLAVFSLNRLQLQAAVEEGDGRAARVMHLRQDANYTLVTILLGNVAINVLLTLLVDSVLVGVSSFLFSTVVITFVGEILPQAYFTRHALRVASLLAPLLALYRVVLWPVARPVGRLLDRWVGPEGMPWYREAELRQVIRQHARSGTTELDAVEATGAINFLALDDIPVGGVGEMLDPDSIVQLPIGADGLPSFPGFERRPDDPFLRRLHGPSRKWIVLLDDARQPRFVINANAFLREALLGDAAFDPAAACHRPLVVRDPSQRLGEVLQQLRVRPEHPEDDVVDDDLILVWTDGQRRIITGADLLGRLLRGIARVGSDGDAEAAAGTADSGARNRMAGGTPPR
jgi:metal transporter CNNM